jgi:predicted MFS family arabinose efflux permease
MGPLLGGALSQAWGWRSTFIALTAFAGLCGLVVVALVRTETHQYFVIKRLAQQDPERAKGLQEWESVTSEPPVFSAPWVPLRCA